MKRVQRGKKEQGEERNMPLSNKNLKQQRKRQKLNESSFPVAQIDFNQPSTSTEEEKTGNKDAFSDDLTCDEGSESDEIRTKIMRDPKCQAGMECQTTELEYLFQKSTYRTPDEDFFDSDEVCLYTGLPSLEVLMVVFDHVASHVKRQTQSLDRFQEFIIVLVKFRLNVPLKDLAYHFVVLISTISRIFFHSILVMDKRLFPFVYWPDRHQLWKTMPQCFQYAFGKKTTVVIDSFEVLIERPPNFLARANFF